MKRSLAIFLLAFCFLTIAYSQKQTVLDSLKVPGFIDTLFIDRDINYWSIRVYSVFKSNRFSISNEDSKINFVPNNPYGIGVGIATRKLLLDIGLNIKGNEEEPTKRFDIQANMIYENHVSELFIQRYQGFNVEDNEDEEMFFRNDLITFSMGIQYMYLFNSENYSIAANSTGLSRQKKAAASFGLGGFLFIRNQTADSTIIPGDIQTDFNEEANIVDMFGIGTGVHGGFTVIFPLPCFFFISLSGYPGIGLMYKKVSSETKEYVPSNPLFYKADVAGTFGFNSDRIYITFKVGLGFYDTSLDYGNKSHILTAHAKLALGYKLGRKK